MPTQARAASHESRRDAASRNLLEGLGPTPEMTLREIRPEHLDLSLGDSVNVTHGAIGWGDSYASRRHMRITGLRISPRRVALSPTLLDIRGGRLNVGARWSWNFEDAGPTGSGMAQIVPHNGVVWLRPARAWVDDPRGSMLSCVEADMPRAQYISATQAGLLSERRGKQLLYRTSFGTTSLSAHSGSGTTTEDTSSLFSNSTNGLAGSFKRVILTAGSPHSSDGVQAWPLSRAAGSGSLTLSFYHHDDAGATLNWRLQRTSDSKYWNEGTRSWQVASVNNAMASVMTTPGFQVAARGITGAATTYTVSAVQASGGTAARVNRIHHVQLEEKAFASSPMPFQGSYSETCPGYRDDDLLQVCNDSTARVFNVSRGTLLTRFRPKWSTADVDGLLMHVFAVEYDSSNSIALYYDGVNSTKDRWVLAVKAGGSTTTIAASSTVTRDTQVKLGLRWASSTYDELGAEYSTPSAGVANYDIWSGAAVLASGTATMPTESTSSRLQVFTRDGQNIDGICEDFTILKTVLSSTEMAAAL